MHSYSIHGSLPPPHKQGIISCILNKTTPSAKIKSLTAAASAHLVLPCPTGPAITGRASAAGAARGHAARGCGCPVPAARRLTATTHPCPSFTGAAPSAPASPQLTVAAASTAAGRHRRYSGEETQAEKLKSCLWENKRKRH